MPVRLHFVDGPAETDKPIEVNRDHLPNEKRVPVTVPSEGFGVEPKIAVYELDKPYDGGQEGEYKHTRTSDALQP